MHQEENDKGAACIFADPTEVSNEKKTEASDWSNLHLDEPCPFSNIVDVNINAEMFNYMTEFAFLVNYGFQKKKKLNMNIY